MTEKMKIVVVEEDDAMRALVTDVMMYSVDRDVIGFESGVVAWQYFKGGGGADLLLADHRNPFLCGAKLITKLRSAYPGIRCVLMIGANDDKALSIQCCADACLRKPFSIQDLFGLVARLGGNERT